MSDTPPPPYNPSEPSQPSYGVPPSQPPYGVPPAQPQYGQPPVEHPQGTTILVLGILSLVCCGIFTGIPAIIMGRKARAEMAANPNANYSNSGVITAGYVCGIIGTAWSAFVIIIYVIMFIVALTSSGSTY